MSRASAAPRTAGWSRPGADDGGGRSPGSRVVALIPSSWGGALRLQLRAQHRNFTGFPFSPPFDGRHLRWTVVIAAQHGLSIAGSAARAPVCFSGPVGTRFASDQLLQIIVGRDFRVVG